MSQIHGFSRFLRRVPANHDFAGFVWSNRWITPDVMAHALFFELRHSLKHCIFPGQQQNVVIDRKLGDAVFCGHLTWQTRGDSHYTAYVWAAKRLNSQKKNGATAGPSLRNGGRRNIRCQLALQPIDEPPLDFGLLQFVDVADSYGRSVQRRPTGRPAEPSPSACHPCQHSCVDSCARCPNPLAKGQRPPTARNTLLSSSPSQNVRCRKTASAIKIQETDIDTSVKKGLRRGGFKPGGVENAIVEFGVEYGRLQPGVSARSQECAYALAVVWRK